jgi:hypothetical protein
MQLKSEHPILNVDKRTDAVCSGDYSPKNRRREMSMWDHKAAYALARAVDMHMKSPTAKSQQGHQLIGVYMDAKRAATTDQTGAKELDNLRARLCLACRQNTLYKCDVDEGWSPKCAFIGKADS